MHGAGFLTALLPAWLAVALGGALGALARHAVGLWTARLAAGGFPWATLAVNVAGSLALGALIGWLASPTRAGSSSAATLRLLVATGFLGAFTTYSTFAVETVQLLRTAPRLALANLALQLLLGLGAAALGLWLTAGAAAR